MIELNHTPDFLAAGAAKLLQLCPTWCDPIDGSAPGSPIPGILQARTLEWVAISFSNPEVHTKANSVCIVRLRAHNTGGNVTGYGTLESTVGQQLPGITCMAFT